MNETIDFSLDTLLNLESFALIQSEVSDIVRFSLVTVNMDGTPIASLSNFTSFCQLIRSSKEGRQACINCDHRALKRALKENHPIVYDCHCGLKDCAAPIVLEDVPIGGVLGGQVLIRETDRRLIDTERIAQIFNLNKEDLDQALKEIPVVTADYLQIYLKFYTFFARYTAEMGYRTLTQQQLTKETMERIRQQQIAADQLIKRLQAQMNPHFLFNALNSIARTALIEGAAQTEQLIYDLSNYLRYTIKNKSDTPTIAEELDNLHHYLNIQNLRFGDKISFQIQIEDRLKDYRVPSMTLQPLVENSIIHGLKDCTENGLIKITISSHKRNKKHDIVIEIYDNGAGVPQEVLDVLKADQEFSYDTLGLGLYNTQMRIRKMYGPDYGITIDSQPMSYTRLTIIIPAVR